MKIFALILAGALLASCSAATQRLNNSTGTTIAQRCVDYRATLAGIEVLQATDPE